MRISSIPLVRVLSVFALATALVSTPSCKDNDDQYTATQYSLSSSSEDKKFTFTAEENRTEIRLESNRRWSASTNVSWINISPSSGGAGKYTVVIDVLKNAGSKREGQINFSFGSTEHIFKVEQAGAGNTSVTPGAPVDPTALAAIIAQYQGSDVVLSEDKTFDAVVLTDATGGNSASPKNITVQAGEVGVVVRLNENSTYKAGDVLTFKTKGAKLSRYQGVGVLQLDYTGIKDAITPKGLQGEVTPKALTLSDIYSGGYDNILVAVDDVQFVQTEGTLNSRTSGTAFQHITDCVTVPADASSDGLSVAVSFYAKFKATPISDKRGRIVGILSLNSDKSGKKHFNIYPRTEADLQLTAERCTSGSTSPTQPSGSETDNSQTGKVSLSDLLSKYDKGVDVTISEDLYFEATLLNDITANNLQSLQNLYLQSGDKGIVVRINKAKAQDLTNLTRNSKLKIKVKDVKLSYYNGLAQLGYEVVALTNGQIEKLSTTESVSPRVVTPTELDAHTLTSILATIHNVRLSDTSGTYFVASGKASSNHHTLQTTPALAGVSLSLGVSKFAQFASDNKATGTGSITGILVLTKDKNGAYQYALWPRDKADIQLSNTATGANSSTPAPQPTTATTAGEPIILTYLSGKAMDKFIQLYNPTDSEISLKGYSLRMDNFSYNSKTNEYKHAEVKTLDLADFKIPAKGIITFANTKATYKLASAHTSSAIDLVCNFNGDDPVALYKGDIVIDILGAWGTAWTNKENGAFAKNKSLKRKSSVTVPSTSFQESQWTEGSGDPETELAK